MKNRQVVWSIPEGGSAVIQLPPMGIESLDALEEVVALMFRGHRREALKTASEDPGAIEYASWLNAAQMGRAK